MFKFFKGEDFINITHADMDGAGCTILLKHCCPNLKKIIPTGYGRLNKILSKKYKNLFITDLNLDQHQIDLLTENAENVIFLDHHEADNIKFPKSWKVYISKKACGSKLIYLYLTKLGFDIESAKNFVNIIDDYDRWIHKNKISILLNNSYWDLRFFKFCSEFKNFKYNRKLLQRAKYLQEKKEKEIAAFDSFVLDISDSEKLRITVAPEHISDISLFYKNETNHLIIKDEHSLSLRSLNDLIPFYELMRKNKINAGGHKYAGGISSIKQDKIDQVIEEYFKFLGGKIED